MADYAPERGPSLVGTDIVFGKILCVYLKEKNDALSVIKRRVYPVAAEQPSCRRWDLLLPVTAPDALYDLDVLCARYSRQTLPNQRDLMTILTLRFPAATISHAAYEHARQFAYHVFPLQREVPAVIVQHVPAIAGRPDSPLHCHILSFARRLDASDCTAFVASEDRAFWAAEWLKWLKAFPL